MSLTQFIFILLMSLFRKTVVTPRSHCIVYQMLETSETFPSQIPDARGHIFKLLVLYRSCPKAKALWVHITYDKDEHQVLTVTELNPEDV